MTANTGMKSEIVTSERVISPAFIVNGYIVRSLEDPTSELTFGDVVQISLMTNDVQGGYYEVQRLLLVLTVEQNKTGNFEGLVLPCVPDSGAPDGCKYIILPKQCAEKIDTGEKAIEIMDDLCGIGPLDSYYDDLNERKARARATPARTGTEY